MKRRQAILVMVAMTGWCGIASAREVTFVHGRNSGTADVNDYWHIGYGANNDGVAALSTGTSGAYTYGYDASQSWHDTGSSYNDTTPVCALTRAMYNTPGTDIVVLTHSAGANVTGYMLSIAKNGWSHHCNISPASALSWTTYFVPIAGSFRGSKLANAIYGGTGGSFLQTACSSVGGFVANLVFNQASAMTYALQTNYGSLSDAWQWQTFSAIYESAGWGTDGDDSGPLNFAQWCANSESYNDGVVSANSAFGCALGTPLTGQGYFQQCLPNGHNGATGQGWWDSVSHSSNRRNDYNAFAANVRSHSPF